MKKVIDGKSYDTSTAKKVGFWCNYSDNRDFSYCEEILYLKKTGEFFLLKGGGANTVYATQETPNSYGYGEKINPISLNAAKKWTESRLTGEEYEAIFGIEKEDTSKEPIMISVSMENFEKLKDMARENGKDINDIINEILIGKTPPIDNGKSIEKEEDSFISNRDSEGERWI